MTTARRQRRTTRSNARRNDTTAAKKRVIVGDSALKHGLDKEYIIRMWYDSSCEGFEVRRLPPKETNVIAIRLLTRQDGILEMIAEESIRCYRVFHAQIIPKGRTSSLIEEALKLVGYFGT